MAEIEEKEKNNIHLILDADHRYYELPGVIPLGKKVEPW